MADSEPESAGRRMSDFASSNNMSLTVMTFNLHRERTTDGPNSWEHRKDLCASVINKFSPLIVCTQEGLKSQLDDLTTSLPGYEQFGVSRKGPDDPSDEHCAIFYSRDKVEKMDGGTFWLSESPSVPVSTSWSAEAPAIATWATFQLRGVQPPGFAFQIVNTHLDAKSSRARRRGALLIWQHIATLPPNLPVIFCGTFNTVKESAAGRFLLGRSRNDVNKSLRLDSRNGQWNDLKVFLRNSDSLRREHCIGEYSSPLCSTCFAFYSHESLCIVPRIVVKC